MRLEGKDVWFGAGLVLLLAVGLCRLVGPERPSMRAVSVNALEVPSETVEQGATVTREVSWDPPDDVYLIGWQPRAGAPEAEPELMLRVGDVRIFEARGTAASAAFFPSGSGYLIRKGQRLTLRLAITNSGPAAESRGARVLIYFVPVAGN